MGSCYSCWYLGHLYRSCIVCCSYYLGLALALQPTGVGDRAKEAIVYLLAGMEALLQHAVSTALQHGEPVYIYLASASALAFLINVTCLLLFLLRINLFIFLQ